MSARPIFQSVSLCVLGVLAEAATLVVDCNAEAGFLDIQSAIDFAGPGDTVLVKPGEYVIDQPINFNRDCITPGPGGKNLTLRSEGGPEVTTIRMAAADDFYASVVIFQNGESADSILEGFTLTGGGGKLIEGGGGILCKDWGTSPTVINCVITGNHATEGGGVSCYQTEGISHSREVSPTFISCAITRNLSRLRGGGVACTFNTSPTFRDCTIAENFSLWNGGGGISFEYGSAPSLVGCTIKGNTASNREGGAARGGGVQGGEALGVMENCLISGNTAEFGGGIFFFGGSPRLTNCAIFGNQASEAGGGVYFQSGEWFQNEPTFNSCTISGNSAQRGGGALAGARSFPSYTNCIIQGNSPESFWGEFSDCLTSGDPLFVGRGVFDFGRFVSVDLGWYAGDVPDFVVEAPNFHLRPQSPAIDVGPSVGAPEFDIERTPRPQGAGFDIGAYEYVPPEFLRGECTGDGVLDIADSICVLGYLFGRTNEPCKSKVGHCLDAADANDDGRVDIADAVELLMHLFGNGGPLPAPFLACGVDSTRDVLGCEAYVGCR